MSVAGANSLDRIAVVLGAIRKKGVELWAHDGQLRYKGPRGALTPEELETLRLARGQIIDHLQKTTTAALRPADAAAGPQPAPLAFSQLLHWNTYHLGTRPAIRQIASATRLTGPLNVGALNKSLTEMVRRHESLRTRIVMREGAPFQQAVTPEHFECVVEDLTTLRDDARDAAIQDRIEKLILEPIDVTVGPLFGARLLKLRPQEHVLIVVMEHLISDAYSMNIFLQELFAAYGQAANGLAFTWQTTPVQFSDYALWQRNSHLYWLETHGAYWSRRMSGCERVRFPTDRSEVDPSLPGWGSVDIHIRKELKARLRDWCRLNRTTLVMSVFTAYAAWVLRWCKAPEALFQYQADGRTTPSVHNAVGYFASVLYLRVTPADGDTFVDLLKRVTDEYCRSYEHADSSYLATQLPRPPFTQNTVFNWVPQPPAGEFSTGAAEHGITLRPVPFEHPMLEQFEADMEPSILLYDTEDEITGGVCFPLNRFSPATLERFTRDFLTFIERLLHKPQTRLSDVMRI